MSLHEFRRLIPNPFASEAAAARFAHRDVGELTHAQLWAEISMVEIELARRITWRERPQILVAFGPTVIDEDGWLLERLRALRTERQRRGSSRG